MFVMLATGLGAAAGEQPDKSLSPAADKACRELASKIEAAANGGDFKLVDQSFDVDAMLERATVGLGLSAEDRAQVKGGSGNMSLGPMMAKAIKDGGACKFLRLRTVGNEPRALFRVVAGQMGTPSYYELVMSVDKAGKAKVCDIYTATSGECLSESLRRLLLPAVAEDNKDLLAKLSSSESDFIKSLPKLTAVLQLNAQGKTAEAMKALLELPPSVQRNKNVLIQRVAIASKLGTQEFASAIEEVRKVLPNDPCLDALTLAVCIQTKQYDEVMKATEKLDAWTGGDPGLDVCRGIVQIGQGKHDKAKEYLLKAIAAEPSMAQARVLMLMVCIELKDYAELAKTLTYLENDMGVQVGDLTKSPAYAGFVQSEEYKKWQAARKPKPSSKEAPSK